MTDEMWKPVVGFEGRYEVSSLGRVRSFCDRHGGTRTAPTSVATPPDHDGRSFVNLIASDGRRHRSFVGRLVLLAFVGPPPQGKRLALHEDDIPSNNTLENLRWGSNADNSRDAARNGKTARGERHGNATLDVQKVLEIRRRAADGEPQTEIAHSLGTSASAIAHVLAGRSWSHVSS
jgi:hypothetical protein